MYFGVRPFFQCKDFVLLDILKNIITKDLEFGFFSTPRVPLLYTTIVEAGCMNNMHVDTFK